MVNSTVVNNAVSKLVYCFNSEKCPADDASSKPVSQDDALQLFIHVPRHCGKNLEEEVTSSKCLRSFKTKLET